MFIHYKIPTFLSIVIIKIYFFSGGIISAIKLEDKSIIAKAHGIGTKRAEHLIVHLKDKIDAIDCHDGVTGVPVLPEFSAVFECQTENIYDGGDHKIIIGRVLSFEDRKTDPLIFYRGHFLE